MKTQQIQNTNLVVEQDYDDQTVEYGMSALEFRTSVEDTFL